mgnify:CR=1 FL=1
MIKINKFLRNKPYQFVLVIILAITIIILNYYSTAKNNQQQSILNSLDNIYLNKSLNFLIDNLNPRYKIIKLKITEGDTFEKILDKTNIPSNEKKIILKKLSKFKFLNNLYKGQNINFKTDNDTEVAAGYLSWHLREGATLQEALESALCDLDGFYTFAVGTREGFAVLRDPIACKPAVLAETDDYVAMASEFQALADLPGIDEAEVWEPKPARVYTWGEAN